MEGTEPGHLSVHIDRPWPGGEHRAELGPRGTVARRLLEILRGHGIGAGDRIPSTEQLAAELGIPQGQVREGVDFLREHGLVSESEGAGSVLAAVHTGSFARTSSLYFDLAGVDFAEMFEAWRMTAPPMAGLAAVNPDRDLVRETLAPFLAGRFNTNAEIPDGAALHAAVAHLARNKALLLLTRTVGHLLVEQVLAAAPDVVVSDHLRQERVDVADAIARGHRRRAEGYYADYVDAVVSRFRERYPDLLQRRVLWEVPSVPE